MLDRFEFSGVDLSGAPRAVVPSFGYFTPVPGFGYALVVPGFGITVAGKGFSGFRTQFGSDFQLRFGEVVSGRGFGGFRPQFGAGFWDTMTAAAQTAAQAAGGNTAAAAKTAQSAGLTVTQVEQSDLTPVTPSPSWCDVPKAGISGNPAILTTLQAMGYAGPGLDAAAVLMGYSNFGAWAYANDVMIPSPPNGCIFNSATTIWGPKFIAQYNQAAGAAAPTFVPAGPGPGGGGLFRRGSDMTAVTQPPQGGPTSGGIMSTLTSNMPLLIGGAALAGVIAWKAFGK